MLGWFNALMPKEGRFFALFAQHATIVVAGAEALRSVLKGGDDVERYCRIVSERENEADEITHQVLIAVRRTFITPFDRSDIQDLISLLDDSIDQMNKPPRPSCCSGYAALSRRCSRWATLSCRRRS